MRSHLIRPTHVHPLTAFKRDTKSFLARLRKTGEPEVLTVDGRGALVVMDVDAYRKLLDEVERADVEAAVRDGLADLEAGRTMPLGEFERRVRGRKRRLPQPRD